MKPEQTDLWRDRPATAADYRAAAEAALQNPYEPPERCQQRAAHYLALAARLESPTTPTPEHA